MLLVSILFYVVLAVLVILAVIVIGMAITDVREETRDIDNAGKKNRKK